MDGVWIVLGVFIFAGFTLEALTGFGGTVIALALGALLLPIAILVPILVPLSVCLGCVMVCRYRGHIDGHLLLRVILPGMLSGTALGYLIRPWFAARELWRMRHASAPVLRPRWTGEWLHHRVGEERFRTLIYVLLLVTGSLLAWPR